MSLHVLKKKTATRYGRHSNKNGFSLNNSRRVESHSNQVQTQTPFKGYVPKGHGGCCGTYKVSIQQSQYVNDFDPFDEPKPTTLSNHALISKKLRPLYSGYPKNVVQPTVQDDYETYIQGKVAKLNSEIVDSGSCICDNKGKQGNYNKVVGAMDYSTYMATRLKTKNCLNPPKLTYPPRIQRNTTLGCYDNMTYEQYFASKQC